MTRRHREGGEDRLDQSASVGTLFALLWSRLAQRTGETDDDWWSVVVIVALAVTGLSLLVYVVIEFLVAQD
jgi:hypothetical protein